MREMNRLGMLVDVAHSSVATARQVVAASLAPVIASHVAARAVCDLPQNLPDNLLREIVSVLLLLF